jgi:hypothetical protein
MKGPPTSKTIRLSPSVLRGINKGIESNFKYMGVETFCRVYDVSHGKAFALIRDYPELSVSLPNQGKKRGKRLFIVERVDAYFARLIAEQEAKRAATKARGID